MQIPWSGQRAVRSLALVGLIGAGVYAMQRSQRVQSGHEHVIDWERTRAIAIAVATRGRREQPVNLGRHTAAYQAAVAKTEPLIAGYLHTKLPRALETIYVFDRPQWIDANIASFKLLFEPIEHVYAALLSRLASQGFGPLMGLVNSFMISTQMGLLLGYLARRVLGQYDIALLGREPLISGKLYFVEENIGATERVLGIPAEQFRLWICLHEATHAYEFEGHPWLAEYLNSRIREHMEAMTRDVQGLRVNVDPSSAQQLIRRLTSRMSDRGHWLEFFMSDQQKELFRQLQAVMCLLEGYSNHVMDHIGALLMPDYGVIKERFEARRQRQGRLDRLWNKLTGLEMKLEQYVLGETFVNAVVAQRGIQVMNRAFESVRNLPDMQEIREPLRWLARMDRAGGK